jgi:hypothetical protein
MATSTETSLESAASEEISLGTSLQNEWYLLTRGIAGMPEACAKSAQNSWNHKTATAAEIGISFAFGLGIGVFSQRAGVLGKLVRGAAAAAGLSFMYDGIKPWKEACGKAWSARSQVELDFATRDLSNQFGRFSVDSVIMTPGAIAGTFAGAKLRSSFDAGHWRLPGFAGKAAPPSQTTGGLTETAAVTTGGETTSAKTASKVTDSVAEVSTMTAKDAAVLETTKPPEMTKPLETSSRPGRVTRYKFEQLNPASEINPRFDFGIEVSDPRLLRGQPNLDHHSSHNSSATPSACEQALALPSNRLPKPGSILATIRPDSDSITAMAVLANRLEGRPVNEALVREIGRLDRGLAPTELYSDQTIRDLIQAIRRKTRFNEEIHKKVFFVKDVLDGSVNMDYVQRLASRHRELARERHARLNVELEPKVVIPDKVVFVKSDTRLAMGHGYRHAPVVILQQETPHFSRYSVGVDEKSDLDRYLGRAIRELNKMEPGWGGRSSIFGSPQDRDTKLTPEQVIDVVKKYVDPPTYKRYLWNATDYLLDCRPIKWFVKH